MPLSVLLQEQPFILRELLSTYVKEEGAGIVDLTYGSGKLWRYGSKKESMWNGKLEYNVYEYDLNPTNILVDKLDITDSNSVDDLIRQMKDKPIKALVYDPPYKYDKPSKSFLRGKDRDWGEEKTLWTEKEQVIGFNNVRKIGEKILQDGGFIFVKIMDVRDPNNRDRLIPNHVIAINEITRTGSFTLFDNRIYIRLLTGAFPNTRTSQVCHGYWLIFKKVEQ